MSLTPVALTPVLDVEVHSSKYGSYMHSSPGNTWNYLCDTFNKSTDNSDYLDSFCLPGNRKHMTMLPPRKKDNIIHVQTSEDCQNNFKNTGRSYCNDSNDDDIKKTEVSLHNFTLPRLVKKQKYSLDDTDFDAGIDDGNIDSEEKYDLDINNDTANRANNRTKKPRTSAVDGKICVHHIDNGRAVTNSLHVTSDINQKTEKSDDSSSFKADMGGVCSDAGKSKVDKIQDPLFNAVRFKEKDQDRVIKKSFSNSSLMLYDNTSCLPYRLKHVQLENASLFQRRNALSDPEKMTMKQTTRERLEKDTGQRKKSLKRKLSNFLGALLNLNIEEELI